MSGVLGFQPGRSSGLVTDNEKQLIEGIEKVEKQLAILNETQFSGPGGALTLTKAGESKVLVGGPSITIPVTGVYYITIGMRMRIGAAGGLVSMQGGLAVNGVPGASLFVQYVASGSFDLYLAETTSRFNVNAGEKLETYGEISQSVECIFDFSRILTRRIS